MNALLAQVHGVNVPFIAHVLVAILIVLGIFAIFAVVIQQLGVVIPAWVVRILWIAAAVCLGAVLIYFLASLW
jgi:hypothetical protein